MPRTSLRGEPVANASTRPLPPNRGRRGEPLPDFTGVDIGSLTTGSGHPVLSAVLNELVAWWPAEKDAVVNWNDATPPPNPPPKP